VCLRGLIHQQKSRNWTIALTEKSVQSHVRKNVTSNPIVATSHIL
jgi:hypothetical protein